MTQLQMFDPRLTPTATAAMLDDADLKSAIAAMRGRKRNDAGWPYVERLLDIDGHPAWAVDDADRWRAHVVWECEIKKPGLIAKLRRFLR